MMKAKEVALLRMNGFSSDPPSYSLVMSSGHLFKIVFESSVAEIREEPIDNFFYHPGGKCGTISRENRKRDYEFHTGSLNWALCT